MESKKELRKRVLDRRNRLTKEEAEEKSSIIANKLKKKQYFLAEDNVLIYIDYNGEVITRGIIEDCLASGKRVACPRIDSDGVMRFYEISDLSQVRQGYKGIMEPCGQEPFEPETALVVMPGVAFDGEGYRLGYGKGFYDTYLQGHERYVTVALAFSCQMVEQVPRETHDVRVAEILTENGSETDKEW